MKLALISVSDKTNLSLLTNHLLQNDYQIISTGGTYKYIIDNLEEKNKKKLEKKVIQVSDYTGFPEILDGRVKTLHPKIYGGLLYDPSIESHLDEFKQYSDKKSEYNMEKIDLVVSNLYPFQKVIMTGSSQEVAIENIDIGGVSLIRASSKNYKNVTIITSPLDYQAFININDNNEELLGFRKYCAIKGFEYVTEYDQSITSYFDNRIIYRKYVQQDKLKYGCNPYQDNAYISTIDNQPLPFVVLNGKPGYINYLDAINSFLLVSEIYKVTSFTAAASFKHTAPAGVGISLNTFTSEEVEMFGIGKFSLRLSSSGRAYTRARNCDPLSSFGDFVAISGVVDVQCAKLIKREVCDGIIAFGYLDEALEILKEKKNGNFIILKGNNNITYNNIEFKEVGGICLSQRANDEVFNSNYIKNIVTENNYIPDEKILDLTIANITLKYTPSNSISLAYDGMVIGVGAGQQNRVDCIKLAGNKSKVYHLRSHPKCLKLLELFKSGTKRQDKVNAVIKYINGDFSNTEYMDWIKLFNTKPEMLTEEEKMNYLNEIDDVSLSSDAFFPFRDNIDTASKYGVKYIIQPGGSIQDGNIRNACNEYGMAMITTDKRMFLH